MKDIGLNDNDIKVINNVFENYPQVEKVILYGSRAKGNFKPTSDIDLTLKGEGIELSILFNIENDLDDLMFPQKFDLSIFQKINNLELINHIDRIGISIFEQSIAQTK